MEKKIIKVEDVVQWKISKVLKIYTDTNEIFIAKHCETNKLLIEIQLVELMRECASTSAILLPKQIGILEFLDVVCSIQEFLPSDWKVVLKETNEKEQQNLEYLYWLLWQFLWKLRCANINTYWFGEIKYIQKNWHAHYTLYWTNDNIDEYFEKESQKHNSTNPQHQEVLRTFLQKKELYTHFIQHNNTWHHATSHVVFWDLFFHNILQNVYWEKDTIGIIDPNPSLSPSDSIDLGMILLYTLNNNTVSQQTKQKVLYAFFNSYLHTKVLYEESRPNTWKEDSNNTFFDFEMELATLLRESVMWWHIKMLSRFWSREELKQDPNIMNSMLQVLKNSDDIFSLYEYVFWRTLLEDDQQDLYIDDEMYLRSFMQNEKQNEKEMLEQLKTFILWITIKWDANIRNIEGERKHLLDTLDCVLSLYPEADISLQVAWLFHDIERSMPGRVQRKDYQKTWDYEWYKRAHANNSAKITDKILAYYWVDQSTRDRVFYLIKSHERIVENDFEQNILVTADSLSFFRCNLARYQQTHAKEDLHSKVTFMYQRMIWRGKTMLKEKHWAILNEFGLRPLIDAIDNKRMK